MLVAAIGAVAYVVLRPRHPPIDLDEVRANVAAQYEASSEPWTRPVLRGTPNDQGNAVAEQVVAVTGIELPRNWDRARFFAAVKNPELIAADLAREDKRLDILLAATQRTRAARPDGIHSMYLPDLVHHRGAYEMLIVRGKKHGVGTCLDRCVDALRMAGDLAAGFGLGGLTGFGPVAADVHNAMMVCSRDASLSQLSKARDAMRTLVEHPILLGRAVAHEFLSFAVELERRMASDAANDGDEARLLAYLSEAAERLQPMRTSHFPEAYQVMREEHQRFVDLEFAERLQKAVAPFFTRFFEAYVYGEAHLRMMLLGLEAQLSGDRANLPASGASRLLVDPFTGDPFAWFPIKKCSAIVSLGPNRVLNSYVEGTRLHRNPDDAHYFVCFEPE